MLITGYSPLIAKYMSSLSPRASSSKYLSDESLCSSLLGISSSVGSSKFVALVVSPSFDSYIGEGVSRI